MMFKLKENECLVYAGDAVLRSPSGEALPAVNQYTVVTVDNADPDMIVNLKEGESLVIIGSEHNERGAAEKRFEALKRQRAKNPPKGDGKYLYVKDSSEFLSDVKAFERFLNNMAFYFHTTNQPENED